MGRSGGGPAEDDEFTEEWDAVTKRARSDMEARRQALAPLSGVVADVSAALLRVDPIELSGSGNHDEYDSEAETIVLRLSDRRQLATPEEVLQIVHEEFVRWFGAEIAGSRDRYTGAADGVLRAWEGYLSTGQ